MRVHNGQQLRLDTELTAQRRGGPQVSDGAVPSAYHGLFGGYIVYDHVASVRLFSLQRALETTAAMRHAQRSGRTGNRTLEEGRLITNA